MKHTRFVLGDWNASCQSCDFNYKASELEKRWDGYMVCKTCWEPKPDAFQKWTVRERDIVDFVNPDPPVEFSCTFITIQGVAGIGVAGCAIAGNDQGYR